MTLCVSDDSKGNKTLTSTKPNMTLSRVSSTIRNYMFNNRTPRWTIRTANNQSSHFQSIFKKKEISLSGARFSYSTNIVYIAGIIVSCIGYGSAIADNQQYPKLNPRDIASEITNLIHSGQIDEACKMIQNGHFNLTDKHIIDFGLAGLMTNCYAMKGDLFNSARIGRMYYDKFGQHLTAEQRGHYQRGMIDTYWQIGRYDQVFAITNTMTETEIAELNVESYISDAYYINNIYDKYFEYAEKYLTNPKSDDEVKRRIYAQMARIYFRKEQFDKVIECSCKMGESLLKSQGMEYELARSYYHVGDLEKAVKYFQDHIMTFNGDQNQINVINAYHSLGAIYYNDKKDIEGAYKYWDNLDEQIIVERRLPLLQKTKCGNIIQIDYLDLSENNL